MRGGITAREISRIIPTMTSATARLVLKMLNNQENSALKRTTKLSTSVTLSNAYVVNNEPCVSFKYTVTLLTDLNNITA